MIEQKKHYVISLKHTHPKDDFITLWRPDNAGYCYKIKDAGIYTEIKEDYHDSVLNIAVSVELINTLLAYNDFPKDYNGAIPNSKGNLASLGLKKTQNRVLRVKPFNYVKK